MVTDVEEYQSAKTLIEQYQDRALEIAVDRAAGMKLTVDAASHARWLRIIRAIVELTPASSAGGQG